VTEKAPEQGTPTHASPASQKKAKAFRVTQAPRYQHTQEKWEAVAQETDSGQKHVVREDSEDTCWDALNRLLTAKGCGGPAYEDADGGTDYNERFFTDEA